MTLTAAAKLKPGDTVTWIEPEDGSPTRKLKITAIRITGDRLVITTPYGGSVECFAGELVAVADGWMERLVRKFVTL